MYYFIVTFIVVISSLFSSVSCIRGGGAAAGSQSFHHQVKRHQQDICYDTIPFPCSKSRPHCIYDTCRSCHEIFHLTPSSRSLCVDHLNVIKPEIIYLYTISIEQLIDNNKWKSTRNFVDYKKNNMITIR